MIDFLIAYDKEKPEFISRPENLVEINSEDKTLQLWGDPINYKEFILTDKTDEKDILESICGHFYYILHDKKNNCYSIGNSVFSVLPVYYSGNLISNNVIAIANQNKSYDVSKRFILENILFNYPLFDSSCYKDIKLLPVNSCLRLNNKMEVKTILRIEDYFVTQPAAGKDTVKKITDVFLDRVKHYFPSENYFVSLTGGFDGRTLASSSLYHKKQFKAYCFGNEGSKDVCIAKELSKKAGINFHPILLGKDYAENRSFPNGKAFISESNGTASFSRAHYLYAAEELRKKTTYIITGNFGSELFRAAHIAGVVISSNLYNLFNAPDFDEGVKRLKNSPQWNALNRNEFEQEWLSLVEDLKQLPCFNAKYKQFTKNQQFYIFVFNEVFRKYFGAEMVNQYNLLINRTPFLDLAFVKELLKTEYAGLYTEFFTDNPLKRYKGQLLYAHVIKKAFPLFGSMETDKGYKPNDLVSNSGKLSVVLNYFKKKLYKNKSSGSDDHGVNASFKYNSRLWQDEIHEHKYFNFEFIKEGLEGKYKNRDSFFIALSQLWWLNHAKEN